MTEKTDTERIASLRGIMDDASRNLDGIAASLRFVTAQLALIQGKTPGDVIDIMERTPSKTTEELLHETLDLLQAQTEALRGILTRSRFEKFIRKA